MDVDGDFADDEGDGVVEGALQGEGHGLGLPERRDGRSTNTSRQSARIPSNDDSIRSKVNTILDVIQLQGMDLISFLDALSWGDEACSSDVNIGRKRSTFLKDPRLHNILTRWAKPPRKKDSHRKRAEGAQDTMRLFVQDQLMGTLENELSTLKTLFSSDKDDVSEAGLTSARVQESVDEICTKAPTLWCLIRRLCYSTKQEVTNSHKNPSVVSIQLVTIYMGFNSIVLVIVALALYSRSHHYNRFQKMFAIYFKFCGLTARGFDVLHALGLTMSHRWACKAVGTMSKSAMDEVTQLIKLFAWLLSYDNINIPFRVFSQRLDNQGEFGNGTAATVYIKRSAKRLPESENESLRKQRAGGLGNPIDAPFIMKLALKDQGITRPFLVYHVLRILLETPDFDLGSYPGRESTLLRPPTPLNQLPCGPRHITLQYLLGTVDTPEASYEDNSQLIQEWLKQLELNSPEKQQEIGLNHILPWIGDQLTTDRLRNLAKFRAEDCNSFERLEWMIPVAGLLHLMMAYGNSLHKQYLGTGKGRGLSQAFDLLNRKNLGTSSTKGPFYHDLKEVLYVVAEAHIRELWLLVGGTTELTQLRTRTPRELVELASKIVSDYASGRALDTELKKKKHRDYFLCNAISWNRDILMYITLDQAIKYGDVGLVECSLSSLAFRFVGGKNGKYTVEVLELLQGLHREWTPAVKDLIREQCWLVNFTGKPTDFLPIDMAQEHNIKDIKVTHRSEGPNVDWDYLKKLHPAIHTIRAVTTHVNTEFKTLARGKKHTIPRREFDIQTLQNSYQASNIYTYTPKRKPASKDDRVKDLLKIGAEKLLKTKVLERWVDHRSFLRSEDQLWSESESISSESEGEGRE
ncbi:hypothetical protein BDN72DRAFT_781667 [Pluteus cervinus]|uniref:Uncharacterized protein n=1 Tax=Pluteus cervinus TaxID=181527 RepID=A0ACD2ZYU4_9AGAR|nr:hypothetical protein BDN72DRAFT_781667 [Pluteus cervinus]